MRARRRYRLWPAVLLLAAAPAGLIATGGGPGHGPAGEPPRRSCSCGADKPVFNVAHQAPLVHDRRESVSRIAVGDFVATARATPRLVVRRSATKPFSAVAVTWARGTGEVS